MAMSRLRGAVDEFANEVGIILKHKQTDAIITFASGKDTFVSLPTGYGKSVIFALLPSVFAKLQGKCHSVVTNWHVYQNQMLDFAFCGG